jgi:N-acetylneuraminic acid mutarotase
MNRKLSVTVFVLFVLLVSLAAEAQVVEVAEANFIPYGTVTIHSPANQTYTTNTLLLNISITYSMTTNKTVEYQIDGQPPIAISGLIYSGDILWQTANTTLTLPKLANGLHRLEVYAKTNMSQVLPDTGYAKVDFTVDAPEEDSWETVKPIPIQGVHGAAVLNEKIYAVGHTTNPVYEYDPATNNWAFKTQVPTFRDYFAVASCQNKIYIIGGRTGSEPIHGDAITCGLNQAYDPATNTWENKAPMPTNRTQMEAAVVDGKIYVMGGRTAGPYTTVNVIEIYDTATDTWTTGAPMIYPVASFASAVVDDKIYAIGGQDEFDHRTNIDNVQIYDTASGTWSLGKSAPVAVWQAAAGATTGVAAPKRIYVMGGSGGFGAGLDQNFVYDPKNDSWTAASPLPRARYNPTVVVVDDLLYIMGGGQNMELYAVVDRYTPIGYGEIEYSPTPSPSPSATPPSPSLTPAPSLTELPFAPHDFYPTPNATDVPLNTNISIDFGRRPQICELNLTPNVPISERTFEAGDFWGGTYIFHLSEQLQPQTTYTVEITFGQENSTSTRTWNFTTEVPTPIADRGFETEDYTITIIIYTSIFTVAAVGTLFYFKKKRRK